MALDSLCESPASTHAMSAGTKMRGCFSFYIIFVASAHTSHMLALVLLCSISCRRRMRHNVTSARRCRSHACSHPHPHSHTHTPHLSHPALFLQPDNSTTRRENVTQAFQPYEPDQHRSSVQPNQVRLNEQHITNMCGRRWQKLAKARRWLAQLK
jgi:hypothetical protein